MRNTIIKNVPKTMRAMVLTGHGGMERYQFHTDWPVPQMMPEQVLIKVHACGLNNTDVNTRTGWYSKAVSEATTGESYVDVNKDDPSWGGAPLSFPRIQGADICGTVISAGANADATLVGKRIMADCWLRDWSDPQGMTAVGYIGSECDGGFAEYMVVDSRNVMAVDSELTHAQLATFACSYTTAENLLNRAAVGSGDTVLITGASGGVGGALVQLANRRGAKTIAMASQSKQAEVALLNPAVILDRSPSNLAAVLNTKLGRDTVSVVIDVVGGSYFPMLIDVLERGGRYATSGAIAGPMVSLDLRTLYLRDLSFQGCTVTSLNVFPDLLGYIERGEISPVLAGSWPLEELVSAQHAFIDKAHVGNIVVTMDSG